MINHRGIFVAGNFMYVGEPFEYSGLIAEWDNKLTGKNFAFISMKLIHVAQSHRIELWNFFGNCWLR